jgi:hypothetical protein
MPTRIYTLRQGNNPKSKFYVNFLNETLFIPKCAGSIHDPMNDGGFHMDNVLESEFLLYPVTKNIGIVVPYKLEQEDSEEFMFKAYVIDPQNSQDMYHEM